MQEKNPKMAIDIIESTLANVEKSEFNPDAVAPLVRQLNRTKESVEAYVKQHEPIIAIQDQKRETEEAIKIDVQRKLQGEQEFAELVDEFNKLMHQRRFAEAEVQAKHAMDLDPESETAIAMFWKIRFARRDDINNKNKLDKEDSFWKQLNEVEQASINPVTDSPIHYSKDWKTLSGRREKFNKPDNRQCSPEEEHIQKSLLNPVNLHFRSSPLEEVMRQISNTQGINVVLDPEGLQDEGITSNTPVNIDVDGIMLKSALDLILEPMHLTYTIRDEVLKITSRMRQQGELRTLVYPVADLVCPIPNFAPTGDPLTRATESGYSSWSSSGSSFSVPGMPAAASGPAVGQAFAQLDPNAVGGGSLNTGGMTGGQNGGASGEDFDTLHQLIVTTIEPTSWTEVGGEGSIERFPGTLSLVIRATEKIHDEIRDLLDQLRRLQDLQVAIEVRFVTVSDRFFERIGVDFDFGIQDNVPGDTRGLGGFGVPSGTAGTTGGGTTGTTGGGTTGGGTTGTSGTSGGGGLFTAPTAGSLSLPALDNWPKGGTIVGMSQPGQFTPDLDIGFQQGSFNVGVPDFGDFNPDAGIQVGMAILSDLEAFFFIQAAQGDERANIMFAPKVTLFNGQWGTVTDRSTRPFVISLIPTVGVFSVGYTPVVVPLPEQISLTVQGVISADRRYVRLTVYPVFSTITDVFTFSFLSQGGGAGGQQGLGGGAAGGIAGGGGGGIAGGGIVGLGGIGGGEMARNMLGLSLADQVNGIAGTSGTTNAPGAGSIAVQQPVYEQVFVQTTVQVPDGGTVLLGGVKLLREGRNMAGVPILNKIPYISRLFKNTGVGRDTQSLMLMVTPRIIIMEEEEELLPPGPTSTE